MPMKEVVRHGDRFLEPAVAAFEPHYDQGL